MAFCWNVLNDALVAKGLNKARVGYIYDIAGVREIQTILQQRHRRYEMDHMKDIQSNIDGWIGHEQMVNACKVSVCVYNI